MIKVNSTSKTREKLRGPLFDTVHSFTQQMFNEYLPCISPVLGPGEMVVGKKEQESGLMKVIF